MGNSQVREGVRDAVYLGIIGELSPSRWETA